jgi:DsbC/DsbD-like thiol-disulfide interchange protein
MRESRNSITQRTTRAIAIFALASLVFAGRAQSPLINDDSKTLLTRTEPVQYLFPEQIALTAGKPQVVALHFRIAPGLHINSHQPKDPALIPTTLSIPESSGVRLADASWPAGADFTQPIDPTVVLRVYTGDFTIQARLRAQAGNHLVEARLRYQACDENACLPPKTIKVPIDVIGK